MSKEISLNYRKYRADLATTRKEDLVKLIAGDQGIKVHEAARLFDSVVESIKNAVIDGKRVELRGFGVFEPVVVIPRRSANPKTGKKVKAELYTRPNFRAGKSFKTKVADKVSPSIFHARD